MLIIEAFIALIFQTINWLFMTLAATHLTNFIQMTFIFKIAQHYLRFSVVYFLALFLKYLSCSENFIGLARPLQLIFQFLYKVFANCRIQ